MRDTIMKAENLSKLYQMGEVEVAAIKKIDIEIYIKKRQGDRNLVFIFLLVI